MSLYEEETLTIKDFLRKDPDWGNWSSACMFMRRGVMTAEARGQDITRFSFYRNGVYYLSVRPRNKMKANEQKDAIESFCSFASVLMEWATTFCKNPRMNNYSKLKNDGKIPYPKHVIRILGPIFQDILEVLSEEKSYEEKKRSCLVVWRSMNTVARELTKALKKIPKLDPYERKILACGAKNLDEVPRDVLNHKAEVFDKEIFEINLAVEAVDAEDLLSKLNGNVERWMQCHYDDFIEQVEEYFSYSEYSKYKRLDYIQALQDRLKGICKGLLEANLIDYKQWSPILESALRLPRFKIKYFIWGQRYPKDAPTEPGLFYEIKDDEKIEQVHYDVEPSKWCHQMKYVEESIEQIILKCKEIGNLEGFPFVCDEWAKIEVKWKNCRAENQSEYHTSGDIRGFASAFTNGLLTVSGVLPNVVRKVDDGKKKPCNSKGYSKSKHRGEIYKGVNLDNDGQTLIIKGTKLKFKGVKQWEILDRIVDAHFADAWAKITDAEYKQFTTAAGKELRVNYLERKKHAGPKKGNRKFSWEVRFKVN